MTLCLKYGNTKEIIYEETLVTKESVASWLWKNGHTQYAVNIFPHIESVLNDKFKDCQQSNGLISSTLNNSKQIIRTNENSLVNSIGIMAWLLCKKINTFKRGDKPNASEIKKYVENVINDLELNNDEDNKIQISNLNKDITTALKQLEGRFKP